MPSGVALMMVRTLSNAQIEKCNKFFDSAERKHGASEIKAQVERKAVETNRDIYNVSKRFSSRVYKVDITDEQLDKAASALQSETALIAMLTQTQEDPSFTHISFPHPSTNYFRMRNKNERDEREGFPVDQPSSPILSLSPNHHSML